MQLVEQDDNAEPLPIQDDVPASAETLPAAQQARALAALPALQLPAAETPRAGQQNSPFSPASPVRQEEGDEEMPAIPRAEEEQRGA